MEEASQRLRSIFRIEIFFGIHDTPFRQCSPPFAQMCESEAHAKEPRGRAPSGSPRGHKGSSGCADREPLFSVDYRPMVLAVLPLFCRANGASDKLRDQNQKEAPQFRGRFGGGHLVLHHSNQVEIICRHLPTKAIWRVCFNPSTNFQTHGETRKSVWATWLSLILCMITHKN